MGRFSVAGAKTLKPMRYVSTLMLLVVGGQVHATDFACSGVSANGELRLVFVQADERELAIDVARQRKARDREAPTQAMVVVNQCIVLGQERFRDPAANTLLDRMPR